jgi:hypothetical protein
LRLAVKLVAALMLVVLSQPIWADDANWQVAGDISVNGKILSKVCFLKQDRHLVFPVLAIAQALGKTATYDAVTRTFTYDNQKFVVSTVVMKDNVAYVGWRDLQHIIGGIEYGVDGTRAVFATSSARTVMPKDVAAASGDATGLLIVNSATPGQAIGPVDPFLVKGSYTLVEFYSDF